jgi:hypothetical protein
VEGVEDAGDVVAAVRAAELVTGGHLEAHPVGDAGLRCPLPCYLDRRIVAVEPDDRRRRVLLPEQDGRGAVAATDVGDRGPGH